MSEYRRFSFSLSVDVSLSLDSRVGCRRTVFFFLSFPFPPFSIGFSTADFGSRLNHIIFTVTHLFSLLTHLTLSEASPSRFFQITQRATRAPTTCAELSFRDNRMLFLEVFPLTLPAKDFQLFLVLSFPVE